MIVGREDNWNPWFELWPQTPLRKSHDQVGFYDDPFSELFGRPAMQASEPSNSDTRSGISQQYRHHGDTENNGTAYQNMWRDYLMSKYGSFEREIPDQDSALSGNSEDEPDSASDAEELEFDMDSDSELWIPSLCLTMKDKRELTNRAMLSDKHMYAAQKLLQNQFSDLGGLQDTCLSQTRFLPSQKGGLNLQIHHTRGNHWVLSSSIGNDVTIYDSMYDSVADDLLKQLCEINPDLKDNQSRIVVADMSTQRGSRDCGLFVIAYALELCHGRDPKNVKLKQSNMRRHLLDCFENELLVSFPKDESEVQD